MKKNDARKQILKRMNKAADILFEANQIACKSYKDLKGMTCYLCEIVQTAISNLEEA